jgi:hypothetical protein
MAQAFVEDIHKKSGHTYAMKSEERGTNDV